MCHLLKLLCNGFCVKFGISILVYFHLIFFLRGKVLLYKPDWPVAYNPPATASQTQACATTLGSLIDSYLTF